MSSWRRSTRESQWEGTYRVGLRSLHGHLLISIGDPQDFTSTSYLAAKADMEEALASIGRRAPDKVQLEEPLPGCWATFSSIRRKTPVPNPAPTSSRSNMPIEILAA